MQDFYFELSLSPSSHRELFSDLILELTQEAIEETDTAIIVRTEVEPTQLLEQIPLFCAALSERTGEAISCPYQLAKKANEDWIENYRQSIQPIAIPPFYVHPSWHAPRSGALNLCIEPALAFGSGHHETTAGCLKLIGAHVRPRMQVLDVGCGSGILGIAAAALGAEVEACDTDPLSVEETRKNFAKNGLQPHRLWEGSIHNSQRKYAIVIANIIADVLEILAHDMVAHLESGGILILSGIVEQKKNGILKRYAACTLLEEKLQGGWVTLCLQH